MTGATSVLGRALLRRLWADPAWAGVIFYLAGRRREALEGLCAEARAVGREARPWVLDLSGALEGLEAELAGRPPLKGFAFAAGMARDKALALLDPADWDAVFAVNAGFHARLLGALQKAGTLAVDARGLLIGSLAGVRGRQGQSAYAAAKGSLADLLPLAPAGLRLNILLPPLFPSPFLDALAPAARSALYADRLLDDPDPVFSCADAAAFLLSDSASYIHRQVLNADSRVTALGWE